MSFPKPTFSLEELLAELEPAADQLDGYYTTAEWREKLGVGEYRMRRLLRLAQRQGKLDARRILRPGIDGRLAPSCAYAFRLGERQCDSST